MTALTICDQRYRHHQLSACLSPRKILVAACVLTIAAISGLDIWFAVESSSILRQEKNPICLWLMQLEPDHFTFFIAGKSTGTLAVLLTLVLLNTRGYRHAMFVTLTVTLFQICLLTFLTLSDPLTNGLPNFSLLFQDTRESIWNLR